MEIVEQLQSEVFERAGSPEGFLRLIQLIIREVEKLDFSDPEAQQHYIALLRAYVLVKRQIQFFNRRCEEVEIDNRDYRATMWTLKNALTAKRKQAREYASTTLPPDRVKELKRQAGTTMSFNLSAIQLNPSYYRPHRYFGTDGE
jgi:hypothetical protein